MDTNSPIEPAAPDVPRLAPTGPAERKGCLPLILGVLLVLIGIPMLVCPGPGVAAIAAGLGMIGASLGIKKRAQDGQPDGE